jgi:[NiFe] hydrogenase assembly HybE family chaperone
MRRGRSSWCWASRKRLIIRENVENPAPAVERVFNRIAATGMAGLPLNNPVLRVEAVGFRPWNGVWVGVLVTPWAIKLMLLPGDSNMFRTLLLDEMQTWRFSTGDYEFMGGCDEELGPYQFCSLFSPAFEFDAHEDAKATAEAVFAELMRNVGTAAEDAAAVQERARFEGRPLVEQPVSRRNFLRGSFLGRPS